MLARAHETLLLLNRSDLRARRLRGSAARRTLIKKVCAESRSWSLVNVWVRNAKDTACRLEHRLYGRNPILSTGLARAVTRPKRRRGNRDSSLRNDDAKRLQRNALIAVQNQSKTCAPLRIGLRNGKTRAATLLALLLCWPFARLPPTYLTCFFAALAK